MKNPRKLAGFVKQLYAQLWKNLVLTKRNLWGLFFEILSPLILIALLIVIRYCIDVQIYKETNNSKVSLPYEPFKYQKSLFYYYPNNTFIKSIMEKLVMKMGFVNMRCMLNLKSWLFIHKFSIISERHFYFNWDKS
jgi:hypothetical protein